MRCFIVFEVYFLLLPRIHAQLLQHQEIEALTQLRSMLPSSTLTHEYMHGDTYLIQYLRATSLNIHKALDMIQKVEANNKWRLENKIDGIIDEVIPADVTLPYTSATDKLGHPVLLIRAGELDVRKIVLSGKKNIACRSAWQIAEKFSVHSPAVNTSQAIGIVDMNGFSYRTHACSECIKFSKEMCQTIEENYPGIAGAVIFINSPRVFEVILNFLKPFLTSSLQKSLHTYGFDKTEWTEALLETISPDQLLTLFGKNFKISPMQNQISHVDKKLTLKSPGLSTPDYYASAKMNDSPKQFQINLILSLCIITLIVNININF